MLTSTYLVLDSETTGLGPGTKAVEVAWIHIDEELNALDEQVHRINPMRPIDPGATAIHNIRNEDVAFCPEIEVVSGLIPQPFVAIGHNCLTGDHEVLTSEGWVSLAAFDESMSVAVWDKSTSVINFEAVSKVTKEYSGEMLEYDTIFHKGIYTPEHTLVYTKTRHLLSGGSPVWETATAVTYANFGVNSVAIPCAGVLISADTLDFTPDECRVLEMVRADANIQHRTSVRFNFSKSRKIERCRYLLELLNIPFSVSIDKRGVTRYSILECPIRAKIIELLGVGLQKSLGNWVLKLSTECREALLDEADFWDGNYSVSKEDNKRQTLITSTKHTDITWFQVLAVLTGRGSRVTLDVPNTRGFSKSDGSLSIVTIRPNNYVKTLEKPKVIQHSGSVFCLTTSTGFFMVRRKGCVWVTGNCSYDLRVLGPYIEYNGDLCTLALSRRWIKGTTNHKLATLKSELKLSEQTSHSALGDCRTVLELLHIITKLSGRSLSQLIELESAPKMLSVMPFGMHRGKRFDQVPRSYREWLRSKEGLHKDLKYTLDNLRII